jgi:capsular exopolysaccharide synthesis family protein
MDPTYFLPKVEAGRFLNIVRRRGWLVILLAVLGAAGLYAFATRLPKTYLATGAVFVNSQAPLVLDIRAVSPEETRDLEQMRSVEQGMSGSSLLMRVIETNELAKDPAFAPPGASPHALLAQFSKRVQIGLRRGTRIIDLQVEDSDPARAKRLVESLVTEYEKWTTERQVSITQQASEGLAREEQRLREAMEASSANLQAFREAHPVPGLESSENGTVRDALATLNGRLTEATAERLRLEAEFEAFAKFDASNPEALSGVTASERGTEVLAQIKAIQQKEADFGRIKERYMYKHPVYKEIANEIKLMKENLADTVRAAGQSLEQRYRVAKENELKLSGEVAQARGTAVDVEGIREQFRSMTRDAEGDRALHDSVALRLRETRLASSVPSSVLRWESTPMVPESTHSPRKIVFAAVGSFLGFFGGVILLAGLEMGDRKVRDTAAASRATGTPLLTTLPHIGKSSDRMVLVSDPSSAGAETFRRMRAILASPGASNSARTLLFASAKAGEGKSFCALNYAASLALQGHRTLLLDADLRHPGLSRQHLAGAGENSGLGGYLDGKLDAAAACFTTELPNLYLLSSGVIRADAAELLAGTRFPALLEDAFRWFDRVVIDTPPILATSDMLAIARYADRTCLVIREGDNDRSELKRASDLVRSAGGTLVGFVWNEAMAKGAGPDSAGSGVPVNRPGIGGPQPVGVSSAPDAHGTEIVPTFA